MDDTDDQNSSIYNLLMAEMPAAPSMSDRVMEHLREEGYRPSIDSDGDINFKREGSNIYLRASTLDEGYYRLAMGFNAEIQLPAGYRAACEITSGYRVLKAHVTYSILLLTIEAYYTTPQAFFEHLETFLATLVAGKTEFNRIYREHLDKALEAQQMDEPAIHNEGVLESVDESSLLA